ncbi:hypothetical protein [Ruegeria meonggei]|uniref:hypothetical protein n=1 Tax=Ruegeria meonggei TaxID=1446476 RepID=UPI00367223FF
MDLDKVYTDFGPGSKELVDQARVRLRSVSLDELSYFVWQKGSILSTCNSKTKGIFALVKAELERRAIKRQKYLALGTTVLAGLLGILGVIVGVFLGQAIDNSSLKSATENSVPVGD